MEYAGREHSWIPVMTTKASQGARQVTPWSGVFAKNQRPATLVAATKRRLATPNHWKANRPRLTRREWDVGSPVIPPFLSKPRWAHSWLANWFRTKEKPNSTKLWRARRLKNV